MFWLGKSIKSRKLAGNNVGLSPIEFVILAHLRSRELRNTDQTPIGQNGYEIIQDLNKLYGRIWQAKSGTIYPILTKLDRVKDMLMAQRKSTPLGPVKKVYTLTQVGRTIIDTIVEETLEADVDFALRYFAMLSPFIFLFEGREDGELAEGSSIMEMISTIPAKAVEILNQSVVTSVDQDLRKRKLVILKEKMAQFAQSL